MKLKILFLLGIFCLFGCQAPSFDHNEYMLVVKIKQSATLGSKACNDDPTKAIITQGQNVYITSQRYAMYSEYKLNNVSSNLMANRLLHMSEGFATLVKEQGTVSKLYCQLKFSDIIEASNSALKALAYEELSQ